MMMMIRWQWYSNLHPRSLIALCTLDQHCCWCSNITLTRLKHIMHTITILTRNSAICTMSCADTISMHHHEHCSVLNAHHLLCSKNCQETGGGLLVQLSQFYHFRIGGWWRWMEMLCYGDVDGDQTEPYPGLAAATKWPHFAHLTQMTSNKYKHFPENLLHLQHSWQTHVNETQWFRKVPSKKSKPFEWGLGWLFGQTYLNQDFPGGASHEMYM